MGNWIDISEQYIKSKTPDECEEHYFTFYYKSKQNNLPTEDDCIIEGPRKISKSGQGQAILEVPINQEKAADSLTRLKQFQAHRAKEIEEEEEELQARNCQQQQNMSN